MVGTVMVVGTMLIAQQNQLQVHVAPTSSVYVCERERESGCVWVCVQGGGVCAVISWLWRVLEHASCGFPPALHQYVSFLALFHG